MKKLFTFWKAMIAVLFFMSITIITHAQDWTQKRSGLYFIGSEGKVFIEPDYSAAAVYFANNEVDQSTNVKFKEKLQMTKRESDGSSLKIELMDQKGMILVKSSIAIEATKSYDDRNDFLKRFDLIRDGGYEILPAFTIGDKQAWFTKRVSIKLKDGVMFEDISDILSKYSAQYIKNITNSRTYLLGVEELENQLPLVQELYEMGVLEWGGPDFKVELIKYADPMYPDQWHLNNTGGSIDGKALVSDIDVNAPEAWAITTGSSNITVAVIDDGVEAHEDMQTLLTGYTPANGGNGAPATSTDGHGQQCAGLISAQHNNIGVRGIAPDIEMFSVNIFAPNTTNADVADGITWAVNQGADVLTNSWGFGSCTYNDAGITDAFTNAANNGRGGLGCVILIASGNDFNSCVSYPADLPNVTAVGGISGDAARSEFSNYGPALDICAPSDDDWDAQGYPTGTHGLRTIDRMGSLGWYSGNYSEAMGGTSGATPQVAAVAALVLSVDPNLTKAQVENILYTTAKNVGDANEYGAGLVDAYAAVVAAGGAVDTDPPSVPSGLSSSNIGSSSFNISWNASSDNIAVTGYNIYVNGSLNKTSVGTSTSVTGLSPNTSYSVRVSAYDAAGNTSAQSSIINVTTTEATLSCSATISSFPYSESFESNDGWNQITADDGNWVRDASGTPSSGTGPSAAINGTYYMFLEASTNGSTGQIGANATAILESDCIDLTGATEATFTFQNHMYGTSIGSLTIQVSVNDIDWTTLWTLSGDQGNVWNEVDISLNSYAGATIKLRIVGTTGSSWSSDIAVDDLNITTGSGVDNQAPTVPGGLTTNSTTQTSTNFSWNASSDNVGVTGYDVLVDGVFEGSTVSTSYAISGLTASTTYTLSVRAKDAAGNTSAYATTNVTTLDPVGGGCTGGITSYPYAEGFESGIGDWTQATDDDTDWTVDANGTPSSSTGPSSATEGSYYLYVESSSPNYPSKTAVIYSPCFDLTGESNATFNFAYHMYGSTMGTLELQASTDGVSWTNLWSKSGDQGNSWYTANVNLSAYLGTSVQLRYVGTTGSSYRSDMAVDDISLTTGSTPVGTDLTLTITFDNYPEETSWNLKNSGGTTVASGGTYASQADGSTLVIPINDLVDDCYDFTILDSYGDGICCSYGSGSYTLEVTGGGVLASGGSFTSSDITNFCLPTVSSYALPLNVNEGNGMSTVNVFPNPANAFINVDVINGRRIGRINIYNTVGTLVKTVEMNGNEKEIDISELPTGLYIISIEDEKEPFVKQFVKQ